MKPNASLPEAFVRRLTELAGPQADTWMDGFSLKRITSFRVNPLKISNESVLLEALHQQQLAPLPHSWPQGAWFVDECRRSQLTHSSEAGKGELIIQNLSSQVAVYLFVSALLSRNLAGLESLKILDLAAAPGGKTLTMAGMFHRAIGARVFDLDLRAVEVVRSRFYRMKTRFREAGAGFVKTFHTDGRFVGKHLPSGFDAVILDAPCSSEAVIQAGQPESWAHWSEKRVSVASVLQDALLESAWQALKPGGLILYSTCSTAPEENEAVVSAHLVRHQNSARLLPLSVPLENARGGLLEWRGQRFDESLCQTSRLIPDRFCDPFFMALIEKQARRVPSED